VRFLLSYEETIRFHGHNGPFLAIGYRAGCFAIARLVPSSVVDLFCVAKLPDRKPFTCIVDGIQCSTSCTFGKKNIRIEPKDGEVEIFFERKDGGRLVMRLIPGLVEQALECEDLDKCAEEILGKPLNQIFVVEESPSQG